MALRRRFRPVFLKHAPRGMARFAKPLQGPFGLAAKHSQKHKNRPKIGRFSHFNPSAEMHPFSPFSASKAPEKWLCDAICRKKQLFAGSFVSRSHSFCSFTPVALHIGPVHFIRDLDKLAANPYSFFISVHAVFPPISLNCEKFRLAGGPLQRENGVSLY